MAKRARTANPTSLIWILAHVVIFLVGVVVIDWAPFDQIAKGISASIGASLIAAGIAGYILFLYVRYSERTQKQIEAIRNSGLENVFRGRSVAIKAEYDDRISKAKELDVLGFGLSAFREDYKERFGDFAQTKKIRICRSDLSCQEPQLRSAKRRRRRQPQ